MLTFVEEGLVYKLPWGIEALRVRAEANLDIVGDPVAAMTIKDFEVGLLAPALETGTLNRSAAILIQAGFSSRTASLKIIDDTNAAFENAIELTAWLRSEEITTLTDTPDWPTRETRNLWLGFQQSYSPTISKIWTKQTLDCQVIWNEGIPNPEPNQTFRIEIGENDSLLIMSPAMEPLGQLAGSFIGASITVNPVQPEPGTGSTVAGVRGSRWTPNHPKTIHKPPTRRREAAAEVEDLESEKILAAYPQDRVRDRRTCLGQIAASVKAGIEPDEMLKAVKTYATETEGYTRSKICFSDNWFKMRRWEKGLVQIQADRKKAREAEAKGRASLVEWIHERHPLCRHITNRQTEDLIALKLVTPEQVRAAGLQV